VLNVSKRFADVAALDHVSLSIEKGEMVGIIGHSGAGKSTLLRMLIINFFKQKGITPIAKQHRDDFSTLSSPSFADCI
jgi:ABC-type multidrug transport system ATPase subunit